MTDGVNTFPVTDLQSVTYLINTSVTTENNIISCRLDNTGANVPLKVTSSVTYTLNFTFTSSTKIESNYIKTVGFLTVTSNHADKIIIDSSSVLGTMAIYSDYTSSSVLDITANTITVKNKPSLKAKSCIIFHFQDFY